MAAAAGACGPRRSPASTPRSSGCRRSTASSSATWRAGCTATPAPAPAATTAATAASAARSCTGRAACARLVDGALVLGHPGRARLAPWATPSPPRHAVPLRDRRDGEGVRRRRRPLGRRLGGVASAQRRGAARLARPVAAVDRARRPQRHGRRPGRRAPGRRRPARHARPPRRARPRAATHHHWDGSTDGTRIDYVLVPTRAGSVLHAAIDHARPGRPPALRPLAGRRRGRAAAGRPA